MPIIEVDNVSKRYQSRNRRARMLLGRNGLGRLFGLGGAEYFYALREVSFSVEPGESLGLIGANGSGKSTLLKVLAGVTAPTEGRVEVRGRVASLLELGAGFHPFLTGRENVYLNAGILGMRRKQVDAVFEDIAAFSGIGEFIDSPVDTYSSGMYVRLAFSVAVHTNPDIFLVDEVLAVGDEEFQRRCRARIGELKEQGKTIVFVSHDLGIVNTICDRVILLSKGKLIARDTARKTIDFYLRQVGDERGLHMLESGGIEAIASNGRLALFKDQREITAPLGCFMGIRSFGQYHDSQRAAWTVADSSPTHLVARGQFARLPASLEWRMRLEGAALEWEIDLDCERTFPAESIELNINLPRTYGHWLFGDLGGEFPQILPGDTGWSAVAQSEVAVRETAALAEDDAVLPPFFCQIEQPDPYFRAVMFNSDYVTGSRVLQIAASYPKEVRMLPTGRRALLKLRIDLGASTAGIREKIQLDRTLRIGDLTARFEQGMIRIAYKGEEITTGLHLYCSMLIYHLWHDSTSLQWGPVTVADGVLSVSGDSRRFPLRQHWRLSTRLDGFDLTIHLEALVPLEVQEHQTSILLRPAYRTWKAGPEDGEFPAEFSSEGAWKHLNSSYVPNRAISAAGEGVPQIVFETSPSSPESTMTPIQTGAQASAHVLQALRTSSEGLLYYAIGKHLFFEGSVRLNAPQ